MSGTVERIETLLRDAFDPASLHIDDESALHAGHAGARDGGGHYRVDIVAEAFAGKNTVARHRMIYTALGELMPKAIHALAIRASAPDEL
ncbi:BolA family transcriptional regulator [Nitrogeniibacter mangrovi]|uniref:BolA family transcriptional regulator n=1 Tax=Nitrogeniibacter mangrovi TaxID=2016596 RepID=A0A6C1B5F1_9RHOO|nr:BolA family protein [Nitrogeniibacter mangrovi]QID17520.1 BolA family transcriptional regulator [Nitrogeniibacter mangrovi]